MWHSRLMRSPQRPLRGCPASAGRTRSSTEARRREAPARPHVPRRIVGCPILACPIPEVLICRSPVNHRRSNPHPVIRRCPHHRRIPCPVTQSVQTWYQEIRSVRARSSERQACRAHLRCQPAIAWLSMAFAVTTTAAIAAPSRAAMRAAVTVGTFEASVRAFHPAIAAPTRALTHTDVEEKAHPDGKDQNTSHVISRPTDTVPLSGS